jgi:hypothetical protein
MKYLDSLTQGISKLYVENEFCKIQLFFVNASEDHENQDLFLIDIFQVLINS